MSGYKNSITDINGNVGIGTASPRQKLDISGNIVSNAVYLNDSSNNDRNVMFIDSSDNLLLATGTSSGARSMLFYTENSERMRIASDGNVGIGTDSPEMLLDVGLQGSAGAGDFKKVMVNVNGGYSTDATFQYKVLGYTGTTRNATDIFTQTTGEAAKNFYTGMVGAQYFNNNRWSIIQGGVERLTVEGYGSNAGNVGIGTDSPTAKLEVSETTTGIGAIIGNINHNSQLQIYTDAASKNSEIWFGDADDADVGKIDYDHSIDAMLFNTNGSERMRITSGGNVLVGTTGVPNGTTSYGSAFVVSGSGLKQLFQASSTTTPVSLQRFYNPNGNVGSIATSGSATAYNTSSDYRLKEDLQDFAGLDMVSKIPVYDFKWKTDESRSYGVMAHELQEVLPNAVSGEKDAEEMQGVDYSKIVPLLIKSIQELKAEIDILKAK